MSQATGRPGLRSLLWRWGPALAWAALIFALSATPGLKVSDDASVDGPLRHMAHMFVYAVLSVLVAHGLGALGSPLGARTALTVGVIAVGYGVLDEIHQALVPDRSARLIDVGYDAIGMATGVGSVWLVGRLRLRGRPRGGSRATGR